MSLRRETPSGDYVYGVKSSTPLQVTKWTGNRAGVTTGAAAQLIPLPAGTELVEITATENAYIAFGDGTVVATATIDATSRLFLAGVQIVPVPIDSGTQLPYTHMSVIEAASAGVFQVEKVD